MTGLLVGINQDCDLVRSNRTCEIKCDGMLGWLEQSVRRALNGYPLNVNLRGKLSSIRPIWTHTLKGHRVLKA